MTALRDQKHFIYFVFACQTFFGAWFLMHGLNYYVEWVKQPPGAASLTRDLISALIATGLFDVVKIMEIILGIALLTNRFVAVSVLAAIPINAVIFWSGMFLKADFQGRATATVIMLIMAVMIYASWPWYRSFFVYKTKGWS